MDQLSEVDQLLARIDSVLADGPACADPTWPPAGRRRHSNRWFPRGVFADVGRAKEAA